MMALFEQKVVRCPTGGKKSTGLKWSIEESMVTGLGLSSRSSGADTSSCAAATVAATIGGTTEMTPVCE